MDNESNRSRPAITLEDNLKKALTELMVLVLLSEQERYIGELSPEIDRRSDGMIHIEFPYAAIYRVSQAGYIIESKKQIAPDGRRRQYYKITEAGKSYLEELLKTYARFSTAVEDVIKKGQVNTL
jgi:PadR family transcriptional regulator PadR